MNDQMTSINEMKARLNRVSPSFCLAKWLQVTVMLQNGRTHSCHHPIPHKVPLEELQRNPSALHNTEFKKQQRKQMLEGQRPMECDYCWNIEDSPGQHISDRYIKSADHWAAPAFDSIATMPWDQNVNPSYLEVSFSNVCNFKCAYCSPQISTKWMEEIREHGTYPTSDYFNDLGILEQSGGMPLPTNIENPYVTAFWKWWPTIYQDLRVFRITGGEPLLTKNTFDIIDFFIANPSPELNFAVNSNLGVPRPLIEKLATGIEILIREKKVKSFTLFTSVDTYGEQAEYIRTGLKYGEFFKNVEYLLQRIPSLQIIFMCTFNALSVVGFPGLVEQVAELKQKYSGPERSGGSAVILDVSYLRYPQFLSVKILTPDFIEFQQRNLQAMRQLSENKLGPYQGYFEFEIAKMDRILDYMKVPESPMEEMVHRLNFGKFITEYDRRRGTSFDRVFPEMKSFVDFCRAL